MAAAVTLTTSTLLDDQLDVLTRQCRNDIAALPGLVFAEDPITRSAGHRDVQLANNLGTFALALVTSGTVTALFTILKSYVDRGVDGTFEEPGRDGTPVKIAIKGAKLEDFEEFLKTVGVLR